MSTADDDRPQDGPNDDAGRGAPPWRLELLGGLRARRGDGDVLAEFPTRRTAGLLAYLACHRHRRHSRDELVALLWPDADPAAARGRLTQALVWLRRLLEPAGSARGSVVHADRLRVGLEPDAVTTDVAEFEAHLEAARHAGTDAARRAALAAAVALYRGDLLPAEYADWAQVERRHLLGAYLTALRDLAAVHERAGDVPGALDAARRAVAADPLREESHHDLIRLLAVTGQSAEALRQLRGLRRLLAAELGAGPSPATAALEESVREGRVFAPAFGQPTAVAPLSSVLSADAAPQPAILHTRPLRSAPLPTPLTPLFGRESEREHLVGLIGSRRVRCVTVTGVAGSGKTRLALAAAAELSAPGGPFTGAIAFIPLAGLDDPVLVPAAMAAAMGLTDSAAPVPASPLLARLADEASSRPFLLVLDNAEHLAEGLAPMLRELLERAPTLSVLVTSRRRFNADGEREVAAGPLPVPAAGAALEDVLASPSVRLFADRAAAVSPSFAVTPENAGAVAAVCARLEGLPLSLELCAAWAQTLTPAQMLERLDQRLDLLVSRRADAPARHRSLRAALEYSRLQLPAHLRRLLPLLSAFRGGWSVEAAAAVCCGTLVDAQEALTHLTELRENSLVVAEEADAEGGPPRMRFRMLETVREYASGLLPPKGRAALRRSHAAYFLALAEQADAEMQGPDQERWTAEVGHEADNLRAALSWSLQAGEAEIGLRLAGALGRYWAARGPLYEGERWLRLLLASDRAGSAAAVPTGVEAKAWGVLGHLAWLQGDYAAARDAHERALERRRGAGDQAGVAESLYHLGITAYRRYDLGTARALLLQSLALAEEQGDGAGAARALMNLGNVAFAEQDHVQARSFYDRSLTLESEIGDRQRAAGARVNLALLAIAVGDLAEAGRQGERALATYRELTDRQGASLALSALGTAARLTGEMAGARALLTEGVRLAGDLGDRFALFHQLLQLGLVGMADGAPARGVFLASAAYRLFEQSVGPQVTDEPEGYREALAAARSALGDAAFEAARSDGRDAPLDAVIRAAIGPEQQRGPSQ